MMRHRRQVHAQPLGHGGIRVAGIHAALDESREVERRQAMPLLAQRIGLQGVPVVIRDAPADPYTQVAENRLSASAG